MLIDEMEKYIRDRIPVIDLEKHPGAQLHWIQKENEDLRQDLAQREETILELERRLTLLTVSHDDLRHRVEKLEKKNKPIERIW